MSTAWEDLARILATMPATVADLLDHHRPDAQQRCPACTVSGLPMPWPCSMYSLAIRARELRPGGPRP